MKSVECIQPAPRINPNPVQSSQNEDPGKGIKHELDRFECFKENSLCGSISCNAEAAGGVKAINP
jgi:hypothetical protein